MAIIVKRNNNFQSVCTVSIGDYQITVDMPLSDGGSDEVPGPHDLYDASLGACKALTVLWYANKRGIIVDAISAVIQHDDSEEREGVYRLDANLKISGQLTDEQIKELTAAAEKCPVHKLMTTVTTEITTTLERCI